MRSRAHGACAALSALAALATADSAAAHVFPMPTYLSSQGTTTVELSVPNERSARLTGFELRVPAGLEVAEAVPAEGWTNVASRRRALWTGGSIPRLVTVTFTVRLAVDTPPGTVVLDGIERFEDGRRVRWPVSVVVVPADEPAQRLGVALAVGLVGLLALTIGGAFLWRRTGRPLRDT
jgi:hypothetical protein